MTDNAKAMVLGSFLGDSLALGVHWIYDQAQIARLHDRIDGLKAPAPGSYHTTKGAGDFTHYGDQTFLLLQSVADKSGFDPVDFSVRWRTMFEGGYTGYVDRATRNTLSQLAAGWEPLDAGSASDDLSAASRIAPLAYAYRDNLEALIPACRTQAAMTHNNGKILDAAEFFARTTHAVLSGSSPIDAMTAALDGRFPGSPLHGWFKQGLGRRFRRLHPGPRALRPELPRGRGVPVRGAAHCAPSGRACRSDGRFRHGRGRLRRAQHDRGHGAVRPVRHRVDTCRVAGFSGKTQ